MRRHHTSCVTIISLSVVDETQLRKENDSVMLYIVFADVHVAVADPLHLPGGVRAPI